MRTFARTPFRSLRLGFLPALALALLATGHAVTAAPTPSDPPEPDASWYEGAEGFTQGFERALDEGQPVLLYFYADWCGYCRQLESHLLYESTVEEYTKYLVKIRINPETGDQERQLARRYGVRGYPTVFVHPDGTSSPKSISRMVVAGGKRRMATPEEYIKVLSMATGETFAAP